MVLNNNGALKVGHLLHNIEPQYPEEMIKNSNYPSSNFPSCFVLINIFKRTLLSNLHGQRTCIYLASAENDKSYVQLNDYFENPQRRSLYS